MKGLFWRRFQFTVCRNYCWAFFGKHFRFYPQKFRSPCALVVTRKESCLRCFKNIFLVTRTRNLFSFKTCLGFSYVLFSLKNLMTVLSVGVVIANIATRFEYHGTIFHCSRIYRVWKYWKIKFRVEGWLLFEEIAQARYVCISCLRVDVDESIHPTVAVVLSPCVMLGGYLIWCGSSTWLLSWASGWGLLCQWLYERQVAVCFTTVFWSSNMQSVEVGLAIKATPLHRSRNFNGSAIDDFDESGDQSR